MTKAPSTKATKPRATASLPIAYDEQLAREAADIAKRIAAPSGDRIRFRSSKGFTTPDGFEGDTLEVVVIDFVSANMFYDRPFVPDDPSAPACFAIGPEPTLLAPSANSPEVQSTSCSVCPNNQFGSAPNGKGKACKNTRLLAVTPFAALDDPEATPPIWIMAVPPTSMKGFDSYVKGLATRFQTVPIGVLTQVTMNPQVDYANPQFTARRRLEAEEIGFFMPLRSEAQERLRTEPDVSTFEPYEPPAPKSRVRR